MKRFLVCAAVFAVVGAALGQNFVPPMNHLKGAANGTLSEAPTEGLSENAQRMAETRAFDLPNLPLEQDVQSSATMPIVSDSPAQASSLPLVPLLGGVVGVAIVGVGVGTKTRRARSHA